MTMKREMAYWTASVALLIVSLFIVICFAARAVHGQTIPVMCDYPASQPSSGLWLWIKANATWLVPAIINILSTVATGLSQYPKAKGIASGVRIVISALSWVPFYDSKGSLKVLGMPSAAPESSRKRG
jgi:hypothetical protein